jgi:hypothetical protein
MPCERPATIAFNDEDLEESPYRRALMEVHRDQKILVNGDPDE